VRRPGEPLGTKTEVKNLNSIKMVEKAIAVESRRQVAALESGSRVEQATLLWDETRETVRVMRTKEDADDYRYFPEPDLPPLVVDSARLARARASLPELPFARRDRFVAELGIPAYDAGVLADSRPLADWYERLAAATGDAKLASNWTMGEVLRVLKEAGTSIDAFPLAPDALAELLRLVKTDAISGSVAKTVYAQMLETGASAAGIVEEAGLAQISDRGAIATIVDEILDANPDQVEQVRQGNEKVLGFLVGQVMRSSGGKANPKLARELLGERIRGD
jgi:aspartyl-tRNA(Asn)/glutamyl-tRNA(Gln) amidotransferase subunit B